MHKNSHLRLFLLKFRRNITQQIADLQLLRTNLLTFSAFDAVGCLSMFLRVDFIIIVRIPVLIHLLRIHAGEKIRNQDPSTQ